MEQTQRRDGGLIISDTDIKRMHDNIARRAKALEKRQQKRSTKSRSCGYTTLIIEPYNPEGVD